ncbi:hypothetical protein NUM3379_10660 [Kineococcus sp. NUM-3379]
MYSIHTHLVADRALEEERFARARLARALRAQRRARSAARRAERAASRLAEAERRLRLVEV